MHTERELTYLSELTAARLRAVRRNARDSQQLVAALLTIHRPALTLVEQDRQHMTVAQLIRFVDHYGVDVRWLLGMDLWYEPETLVRKPGWWNEHNYLIREEYARAAQVEKDYRTRGHKKGKVTK